MGNAPTIKCSVLLNGTLQVAPPVERVVPVANLITTSTISSCQDLVLNAFSYGYGNLKA